MRRLFKSLALFVGIWLLGSFLGVMFDPARANLWTQSLMWALLSCVILAPVFLFVGTASSSSSAPDNSSPPFETENNVGMQGEMTPEEGTEEQEEWPYTSK